MKRIIWGSIGRILAPGQKSGPDWHVRKPHFADLDLTYGKRLATKHIDKLREVALKNGTPERRLEDGFHEDVFLATISDESKDRYGDRILVEGWDILEYRKNPVLLAFHDYESFSVGHALDIFPEKLKGEDEEIARLRGVFLWSRANPEAQVLKELYADGDMRAFSVGFIPEKFKVPSDDDEREELSLGPYGVLHEKQVLLENSAVPVPANPNAIADEYKDALREAIPEEEIAGLRKLGERLGGINDELSQMLKDFLPAEETKVLDLGNVKKTLAKVKATLSPEGDLEDVEPEGQDHDPNPVTAGIVPKDVSEKLAEADDDWVPLSDEDFLPFSEIDDEAKEVIAGYFAYTKSSPPGSFDDLLLAHHRAEDGAVVFEGVRIAMTDLLEGTNGGDTIPEEEREAVYKHLADHYESFGETPPELKTGVHGDGTAEGARVDNDGKKPSDGTGDDGGDQKDLKATILAELRAELAGEIDRDEKASERKWRVVRPHKPKTAPEDTTMTRSDWEKAVGENFDLRRQTSLIYDSADTKNPRSYLMPHHLAAEGTPVVWKSVQRSMRLLLGKAIEGDIPEAVRRRAYFHLRTHYEQFEKEAPAFRSIEQLASLGRFLKETAVALCDGISDSRESAELVLDFVWAGYQRASDEAYEIQALSFPSSTWEKADAEAYLTANGFDASRVEERDGRYVYEQRGAGDFVKLANRTLDDPEADDVEVVGGKVKSEAGLLFEKLSDLEKFVEDGFAELRGSTGNGERRKKVSSFVESVVKDRREGEDYDAILEASNKAAEAAKAIGALNPRS
jgi:hypothetical protein